VATILVAVLICAAGCGERAGGGAAPAAVERCFQGDYAIESAADRAGLERYTCVGGNLVINAPDLESLTLKNIITVKGRLAVGQPFEPVNPVLTRLDLGGLVSVGGDLWILGNASLADLDLGSLTSVGHDLRIEANPALTGLRGLGAVTAVGGGLYVEYNAALTSLDGLQRLAGVGGDLRVGGNPALANLDGLRDLAAVGADLSVHGNDALTGLGGLRGLSRVGGNLEFMDNTSLPQCEVCGLRDRLEGFEGALSCFNNRPDTCSRDCT